MNGSSEFRQKSITVEPLLRFPFVHSLANPCGYLLPTGVTVGREKLNHFESSDQQEITLAPLRDINKEIPLTKQVLDFLGPFHDLIQQSYKPTLSMNNTLINEQSTQELILVVSQALQLIFSIYSQSVSNSCLLLLLTFISWYDLIFCDNISIKRRCVNATASSCNHCP